MPEIKYTCNLCRTTIVKIFFKKEDMRGFMFCLNEVKNGVNEDGTPKMVPCNGVYERQLKAPTSKIVEVLDSGAQPRKVEQMKDIKKILEERSKKHGKS